VQKKERARSQHGVPTNHLANVVGPSVHHHQLRPRYVGVGDKFIVESKPAKPYAEHGIQKEFPMAQVHVISRDVGAKLNTKKKR
jgi:hypothetical protein